MIDSRSNSPDTRFRARSDAVTEQALRYFVNKYCNMDIKLTGQVYSLCTSKLAWIFTTAHCCLHGALHLEYSPAHYTTAAQPTWYLHMRNTPTVLFRL